MLSEGKRGGKRKGAGGQPQNAGNISGGGRHINADDSPRTAAIRFRKMLLNFAPLAFNEGNQETNLGFECLIVSSIN